MKRRGRLLVISGPSGTGKGTICGRVLEDLQDIVLSISMTTRQPRNGEAHGVNYYFASVEEFEKTIAADGFLEYARVYENYYGTPRARVMELLDEGIDVLLEIDVQGALQIKKACPQAVLIFIMPPSLEVLRQRIEGRATDSAEVIDRRMREAEAEIALAGEYNYQVVNDDLETAVKEVEDIIRKERTKEDKPL